MSQKLEKVRTNIGSFSVRRFRRSRARLSSPRGCPQPRASLALHRKTRPLPASTRSKVPTLRRMHCRGSRLEVRRFLHVWWTRGQGGGWRLVGDYPNFGRSVLGWIEADLQLQDYFTILYIIFKIYKIDTLLYRLQIQHLQNFVLKLVLNTSTNFYNIALNCHWHTRLCNLCSTKWWNLLESREIPESFRMSVYFKLFLYISR